jgi:hypothetical protein
MERVKRLSQVDYVIGVMGAMMLIVYWLIVATLPDFFFISPTGEASQLRRAELILSTIGWILASTGAPIALFLYASGYHRARNLLPYAALVWPVSLIISQLTVYVLDGSFYFEYLFKFPIFIYTDFVLPIFILMLWYDLRENDFSSIAEASQVAKTS